MFVVMVITRGRSEIVYCERHYQLSALAEVAARARSSGRVY